MLSSRGPGDLGIYGFRNRTDHGYDALEVADARAVRTDRGLGPSRGRGKHVAEHRDDLTLLDIAPTILGLFGLPTPRGMRGRVRGLSEPEG